MMIGKTFGYNISESEYHEKILNVVNAIMKKTNYAYDYN